MIDLNELRIRVEEDGKGGIDLEEIHELLDRLEAAESDALEQARLNGMGSEREAALLSKLESAEKAVTEAYQRGYATGLEEFEKERGELKNRLALVYQELGERRETLGRVIAERDKLSDELGIERMRLAACGVAALGYFSGCAKEYWSPSLDDVLTLRAKNVELHAKIERMERQEPVKHEFQGRDGTWHPFIDQRHYENTVADGTWPIRALYALPGAKGEEK